MDPSPVKESVSVTSTDCSSDDFPRWSMFDLICLIVKFAIAVGVARWIVEAASSGFGSLTTSISSLVSLVVVALSCLIIGALCYIATHKRTTTEADNICPLLSDENNHPIKYAINGFNFCAAYSLIVSGVAPGLYIASKQCCEAIESFIADIISNYYDARWFLMGALFICLGLFLLLIFWLLSTRKDMLSSALPHLEPLFKKRPVTELPSLFVLVLMIMFLTVGVGVIYINSIVFTTVFGSQLYFENFSWIAIHLIQIAIGWILLEVTGFRPEPTLGLNDDVSEDGEQHA